MPSHELQTLLMQQMKTNGEPVMILGLGNIPGFKQQIISI